MTIRWTDWWVGFLTRWGDRVRCHPKAAHALLLLAVGVAVYDLRSARMDPDWLRLFRADDPVLREYQSYAADGEGGRTLYLRLPAGDAPLAAIDAPGIVAVRPLALAEDSGSAWYALVLDSRGTAADHEETAETLRVRLRSANLEFGLTGGPVMLREFRASVQRDFVWTSLLSLVLVGVVLVVVLRSSLAVLLGVGYELAGMLRAIALAVRLTGDLNMLSAVLPCVLVGLGADFVIHCLAMAGEAGDGGEPAGRIYERLAVPMFGGALTTAAAFASLALADLRGLWSLGVLGALGLLFMFGCVILFLPPMLGVLRCSFPRRPEPVWVPRRRGLRLFLGAGLGVGCLVLAVFAGRLRPEDRLERLYDPELPSLVLLNQLREQLGFYPSPLFLRAEGARIMAAAESLANPALPFRMFLPPGGTLPPGPVVIPLFAVGNPFAAETFAGLEDELARLLGGADSFALTGEAAVSLHMNTLLQRGMTLAFGTVFLVLVVVLIVLFRRFRLVLGPLLVLLAATAGILGLMGLAGIRLSAYTLTLFPLFIGIGVDDCLYVTHLARDGGQLRRSPATALAITLTTVTTMLGYGSLLVARNAGFQAMGATATIGLLLMYAGAVYLLPALLPERGGFPAE